MVPMVAIVALVTATTHTSAQTILSNPTSFGKPNASTRSPIETGHSSLLTPFADVVGDIRHLPSRDNLDWLAIGLAAALATHPADAHIARNVEPGSRPFKAGAIIGGTPFELSAAFATYALGRAANSQRAMSVGRDLVRAQLLSALITTGVKQSVRRSRPEGSGFSFPSGHTSMAFASATVIERHFGWKVGIPAYAVASYVAASRVEMRRHYLSDVTFGAALGILAAHTVTVGPGHRFTLAPIATPDGAAAGVTWIGK